MRATNAVLTGPAIERPYTPVCRVFSLPDDDTMRGALIGAVSRLCHAWAWEQHGEMTPEQAAEFFSEILATSEIVDCVPTAGYPTPFWDDTTDLNDQEPAETQTWYGEVTDPEADPTELTFIENAGIWIITGFIVYAGDIGGAIFFHTIAPRFVLAWNKGDLREIWRVVVDSAEVGRIDTDDYDTGDVIEMNVVADPESTSGHDIYIMQVAP